MNNKYKDIVEAVFQHATNEHAGQIDCDAGQRKAVGYRELWTLSSAAKAGLAGQSIGPGDRVALVMTTSVDSIALLLAIWRTGAVVVPLQPGARLKGRSENATRILAITQASQVKLLIAPAEEEEAFRAASADSGVRIVAAQTLTATGGSAPEADYPWHGADLALIQFSSGSTGAPKGVCLSRANLNDNLAAICERVGWRADDIVVSWLPFYHDLGLIGVLLASLWSGCSASFYSPSEFIRNPFGWLRRLSDARATMTAAPQFAYRLCLSKAESHPALLAGLDLSAVRNMLNGSESIHWKTCAQFERHFARCGLPAHVIQPAYGLAENCVGVTLRPPGTPVQVRRLRRSARGEGGAAPDNQASLVEAAGNGAPIRGTELLIRDEHGNEAPPGQLGEICFRGASASSQYQCTDNQVVATHVDGWVPSGDIGALLDGELYVAGRCKEIFKRGGRTFAPPDIEYSLALALGIDPVGLAAFAYYEDCSGTEQLAVIIEMSRAELACPPTDLLADIKAHALRQFQFQVDHVHLVAKGHLPRTSSGKLRRAFLSTLAEQQQLEQTLKLHTLTHPLNA